MSGAPLRRSTRGQPKNTSDAPSNLASHSEEDIIHAIAVKHSTAPLCDLNKDFLITWIQDLQTKTVITETHQAWLDAMGDLRSMPLHVDIGDEIIRQFVDLQDAVEQVEEKKARRDLAWKILLQGMKEWIEKHGG